MDCHHIAGAENYFTPVLSNADPDSTWVDESWRRLSETNFDEFKGTDCVFVADFDGLVENQWPTQAVYLYL